VSRIRTVKPEYPKNRKVRKVSRDARLLNIHLWNLADDEGRLQELPQWIIGEVFPTDEDVSPGVLSGWLGDLQMAGLIERYSVDGEAYIQCHDFNGHQVISHPRTSLIPPSNAENAVSSNPPVILPEASDPEQGTGKGTGKGNRESAIVPIADAPLSHLLADLVAGNDPDAKRPEVTKRWADAERLLLTKDNRKAEQAEELIRWAQASDFWAPNVQSMPKFREQYGKLWGQANRGGAQRPTRKSRIDYEESRREFRASKGVAA